MTDKLIGLETRGNLIRGDLQKLMLLIPSTQQDDIRLKRLLAFRLKVDGFEATRRYLLNKMRRASLCTYTGNLYDFMKDDLEERACRLFESSGQ